MKKCLLALVVGFSFISFSNAAEGQIVYETATSSISIKAVTLSTSAATLISPTKAQSLRGDGKFISWYSITLFNIDTSSAAYAFGTSETVAPSEATCNNGVPVGGGSATAPWHQTEQTQGMYMWGVACGSASNTIKKIVRGR